MSASLQNFLVVRSQQPALPRAAMLNALAGVAALKQRAVAILDDARDTKHNENTPARRQAIEEVIQSWGAMARELEDVARELSQAIQTIDQVQAVEQRLGQAIQGGNL